jgi:hypothetical protein
MIGDLKGSTERTQDSESKSTKNQARPVLCGWKDISGYLGCGVRTAQRWERSGLPVLRPVAGTLSHVFAMPDEIDRWLHSAGRIAERKLAPVDGQNDGPTGEDPGRPACLG